MDEGFAVDEASLSLSLKRLHGGGLGGSSFTGDLRESPDKGISLRWGPFPVEGNLVRGGASYIEDFDR
jgi:hypothetical protein